MCGSEGPPVAGHCGVSGPSMLTSVLGQELLLPAPKEATVVFPGVRAATQDQAWSRGPE